MEPVRRHVNEPSSCNHWLLGQICCSSQTSPFASCAHVYLQACGQAKCLSQTCSVPSTFLGARDAREKAASPCAHTSQCPKNKRHPHRIFPVGPKGHPGPLAPTLSEEQTEAVLRQLTCTAHRVGMACFSIAVGVRMCVLSRLQS